MELSPYVEALRRDLLAAAAAGGEDARALAERLLGPLESSARLVLFEALGDAAEELTSEVAPGSVEVRLRRGEPEFIYTPGPGDADEAPREPGPPPISIDDAGTVRITLRLPEPLKARVEEAASAAAISVNAWLVRALHAAVDPSVRRDVRPPSRGGDSFTGWIR